MLLFQKKKPKMPKNKKTRTNPIVIVLGIVMLVAFSLWFVFERPTSTVEDSGKLAPRERMQRA
jgi:uncharacterized membrane protein